MTIEERVPLAPLTTFGVGGEARFFAAAKTVDEVQEALVFASARKIPVFILGGGSNILVSDEGFEGLVLSVRLSDITTEEAGDRTHVSVGAGVVWDDFVQWSIAHRFAGLECLSGVPGTVGGAVIGNLGAYGAQTSDTLVRVESIDTHHTESGIRVFEKEACDFSYHDSIFGKTSGRYAVVRAIFALSTDPTSQLSYRDNRFDLTRLTHTLGHAPSQQEIREAILDMREEKGSIIMPGRRSYKCAGSFFHMPFVSPEQYAQVVARARALDAVREEQLQPWAWEQPDGSYKLAPGFLLEYTEFKKGYTRGSVGISPKHTLVIINLAGATACDIANLARDMQRAVSDLFGITLEREVEYVGCVERSNQ